MNKFLKNTLIIIGTIIVSAGVVYATALLPMQGGTGFDSFTAGDMLYANATTTLAKLSIGSDNQILSIDGTTIKWEDPSAGAGDVVGPASATDNAIARFDTVTGKLLQDSGVTIDDSGNVFVADTKYIQLGESQNWLKSDSANFGNGVTILTGNNPAVNRELAATHGLKIYANTDSDGTGTWEPAIYIDNDGDMIVQNTTQGAVGAKFFKVDFTDGLKLDTGDKDAIIKADSVSTTDKTFQFPNFSGTFIATGNLTDIVTTGALDSGSITSGFGTITTGDSISGSTLVGTADVSLTLGADSAADGTMVLYNATNSNTLTIQTGATSGTYTLTLPLAVAGAGEVLTDAAGNGVLSWSAAGSGDVLSVGDCLSGICLDGTSDGGTNITFYNIDSNKTQLIASDTASDLVVTLPGQTGTLTLNTLANLGTTAINTSLVSDTYNTDDLGTSAIGWRDLYLGNTSVIDWTTGASTSDVTLTHSANLLTLAGGNLTLPLLTTTGNIELGHASDTTLARSSAGVLMVEDVVIPSISSTNALTNKEITRRVVTTASDTTAEINVDVTDVYELTDMAGDTTFTLTGTPTDGQMLMIRYKDNGATRALTWTGFIALGITIPTDSTATKWGYLGCQYNLDATQWQCIATVTEE